MRWRPASVAVTDMLRGERTVLVMADDGGSAAGLTTGFVEAVLTSTAPLQRSPRDACEGLSQPPSLRPVPSGDATQRCDYNLKLHLRPASAGWRGHLLFDLEGDSEPRQIGQTVRCATATGHLPLHATASQVPDVGQLQAVHLAVLQSSESGPEQHGTLEAVTVENTSSGVQYHCELQRHAPPDLPVHVQRWRTYCS